VLQLGKSGLRVTLSYLSIPHCVNAVLDGMIFRVAVYWYFAVVLHVDADVSENADWYVFLFTWSPQNQIYLLIYNFCVYHCNKLSFHFLSFNYVYFSQSDNIRLVGKINTGRYLNPAIGSLLQVISSRQTKSGDWSVEVEHTRYTRYTALNTGRW
jgi:hypothetical protein